LPPHTEFKGSPAYGPSNVLYDTSFRNYPSVRLQAGSLKMKTALEYSTRVV
jgi:hypothetical protein